MQSRTRKSALLVSLLAAALTTTHFAAPLRADEKPVSPPKSEQAERVELFSGKIEQLNLETKTLLVAKQTYLLAETTKVLDKEKPIKIADLKIGTEIHGLAKKNAAGKLEATIIKVGPKPHEQAPPAAAKPKE